MTHEFFNKKMANLVREDLSFKRTGDFTKDTEQFKHICHFLAAVAVEDVGHSEDFSCLACIYGGDTACSSNKDDAIPAFINHLDRCSREFASSVDSILQKYQSVAARGVINLSNSLTSLRLRHKAVSNILQTPNSLNLLNEFADMLSQNQQIAEHIVNLETNTIRKGLLAFADAASPVLKALPQKNSVIIAAMRTLEDFRKVANQREFPDWNNPERESLINRAKALKKHVPELAKIALPFTTNAKLQAAPNTPDEVLIPVAREVLLEMVKHPEKAAEIASALLETHALQNVHAPIIPNTK